MGLGLDIGTSSVKLVELRRTLAAKGADESEGRASAARALKEAAPPNGAARPACVGLTGRDLHLQLLVYDQVPMSNYRELIGFEMAQQRERAPDHLIDWALAHAPDLENGNYLTLIGSAKAEWLEARLQMARQAGLAPAEAVPNGSALFALYRRAVKEPGPGVAALLDIGAQNIELVLVRGAELLYMRNVGSGARMFDDHIAGSLGKSAAEAEHLKVRHGTLGGGDDVDPLVADELRPVLRGAAGQLAGVINSSLNYARGQLQDRTLKIEKFYLSGGGARLRGLPEFIRGTLKTEVELLDPFAGVELGRLGDEAPEELRRLPSDLACAVGLALLAEGVDAGPVVSLMPEAVKQRRTFWRRTVWLLAAGAAALLLAGAMTAAALWERRAAEGAVEALQARVTADRAANARMEGIQAELAAVTEKARRLKSFVDPGRVLLESVGRLRRRMPPGLKLREVKLRPVAEGPEGPAPVGGPVEGIKPPGAMILELAGDLRSNEREAAVSGLQEVAGWLGGEGVRSEVHRVVPRPDRPGWWSFSIHVEFGGGP